MSTGAGPQGKSGRASVNATNDTDTLVPLLLAAVGNPKISFKNMAAMDELGRTESSLEHRFRKWRQKGREIAAKHPENTGTLDASSAGTANTKEPRVSAKGGTSSRGKEPISQAGGIEGQEDEEGEGRAMKQEPDGLSDISGEIVPPSNLSAEGKATGIKNPKKRKIGGVSEASATKKKVVKKGTARLVKKSRATVHSSSEEDDEKEVPIKSKGKGRGKSNVAAGNGKGKATVQPTGAAEAGQISIHEDEDTASEAISGDGHDDGMIDMQFFEAA